MPTSKPHNTDDTYTPAFKEQILEVVSTREVTSSCWWNTTLQCGCPLTELARANGFKPTTRTGIPRGAQVLDFNQHNLGHSFNMQSNFIEAFDNYPTNPHCTPYEICERIFA